MSTGATVHTWRSQMTGGFGGTGSFLPYIRLPGLRCWASCGSPNNWIRSHLTLFPDIGWPLPSLSGLVDLSGRPAAPFPTKPDSTLILRSAFERLLTVAAGGLLFICEMKLQLLLRHLTDEHFQQAANNEQSIVCLPNEDVAAKER